MENAKGRHRLPFVSDEVEAVRAYQRANAQRHRDKVKALANAGADPNSVKHLTFDRVCPFCGNAFRTTDERKRYDRPACRNSMNTRNSKAKAKEDRILPPMEAIGDDGRIYAVRIA